MVSGALDELVSLHVCEIVSSGSPYRYNGVTVIHAPGGWRIRVHLKREFHTMIEIYTSEPFRSSSPSFSCLPQTLFPVVI